MKISVRSRWIDHPHGLGYVWRPAEPEDVASIEEVSGLHSDYWCSASLWVRRRPGFFGRFGWNRLSLLVCSLPTAQKDSHHRPIKTSVLWTVPASARGEKRLREILVLLAKGNLARKVTKFVTPCIREGFSISFDDLMAMGDPNAVTEERTDRSRTLTEFTDVSSFLNHIAKYSVPTKKCGLVAAIGPSQMSIEAENYPSLRWLLRLPSTENYS